MQWENKEKRINLLKELVAIPSVSRSEAEKDIPNFLHKACMKLEYFKNNPHQVKSCHFEDGSSYFAALVKKDNTKKTVILIGHYDVVGVDDFGNERKIAFDLEKMTNFFQNNLHLLSQHIQDEIKTGEWLFGRGSMDMKAGVVVEMSLLEKAASGEFDGNVLMVAVSDEEVSSRGMLHAAKEIEQMKKEHDLDYILCLNTEPTFKESSFDQDKYIYTGTVGKIMPTFYIKGQETHVGEPLRGLNASFICSMLTNDFELSADFQEEVQGETTQVLTNLMMRDLKPFYNVQTPLSAVSMFNLLYMEHSLEVLTHKLLNKAKETAEKVTDSYEQRCKRANVKPLDFNIRVLTWEKLYEEAKSELGEENLQSMLEELLNQNPNEDERDKSLKIVQSIGERIQNKSPMIVLYYSPPFYPAISSRKNTTVQKLTEFVQTTAKEKYDIDIKKRSFFQGLCDLSYAASNGEKTDVLTNNMPLFNKGYHIPFDIIDTFDFPVMNFGPYGCDPHQKTERLEINFSFEVLPVLIEDLLKKAFN